MARSMAYGLFSPRECVLAHGQMNLRNLELLVSAWRGSAIGNEKQDQRQDLPVGKCDLELLSGIPNRKPRLAIRTCAGFGIVYARQEPEHWQVARDAAAVMP